MRGAAVMTRLHAATMFLAVVAGAYSNLMLIGDQLIAFGVSAAICGAASVTAALIAYADRRRRSSAPGRLAGVSKRRDRPGATAT